MKPNSNYDFENFDDYVSYLGKNVAPSFFMSTGAYLKIEDLI